MALTSTEFSSIAQLYDFVEACFLPTAFILSHDAHHLPWARAVSSACPELIWFYPQTALNQEFLRHLSNFAHQPLPENPILLIRNGQVCRVFDVDQLNGRAESHRLSSFIRQFIYPEPQTKSTDSRRTKENKKRQHRHACPSDPFETLGCLPTDSPAVIRSKFRELIFQYHPDRVNHLGAELQILAARKTQEINAAFAEIKKRLEF